MLCVRVRVGSTGAHSCKCSSHNSMCAHMTNASKFIRREKKKRSAGNWHHFQWVSIFFMYFFLFLVLFCFVFIWPIDVFKGTVNIKREILSPDKNFATLIRCTNALVPVRPVSCAMRISHCVHADGKHARSRVSHAAGWLFGRRKDKVSKIIKFIYLSLSLSPAHPLALVGSVARARTHAAMHTHARTLV